MRRVGPDGTKDRTSPLARDCFTCRATMWRFGEAVQICRRQVRIRAALRCRPGVVHSFMPQVPAASVRSARRALCTKSAPNWAVFTCDDLGRTASADRHSPLRDRVAAVRLLRSRAPRLPRNRAELLAQLDDYWCPSQRSRRPPLLVVGELTGAGSHPRQLLVGRPSSGRPGCSGATRTPSGLPPEDHHWFAGMRVLPQLTRVWLPQHQDSQAAERRRGPEEENSLRVETAATCPADSLLPPQRDT